MTTQPLSERLADKRRQATATTVSRRDISITEEVEHEFGLTVVGNRSHYWWDASFDGRLSTGEDVSLSRQGDTSAEALSNLEAAIAENGWEIK